MFPAKTQIKPEVTLGLKYSSENLFLLTHDNHPLAFEGGAGVGYNEKWYTGINVNYFKTNSTRTDAKYILAEIELRRSFGFPSLPKMSFSLSFSPGYFFISAYSHQLESHYTLKTIAISLSSEVSYSITEHIKLSIWPGFTWLPQESSGISKKQRIGFFSGAGLTYIF